MKEHALNAAAMPQPKTRLGVVAIIATLFLAAVDSTIVSTALPAMRDELGNAELWPWIMSGFLLPVALIAPLAGACADRLGVSITLKTCLIVFLAASVLAAISPTMMWLIAARVLQGCSAGGLIVLTYALLASLFDASQRGKMQGMLSAVWGLAAIIGPLCGSVLTHWFGWRSIFWFNLPVGLGALLLLMFTPAVGKRQHAVSLDMVAQLSLIVLASILMWLMTGTSSLVVPRFAPVILLLISAALLIFRLYKQPLSSPIPVEFFRHGALFSVIVLVMLSSAGLYAAVTLLPMALSQSDGTLLSGGLLIMLAALGWVVGSAVCGNLLARRGYRTMAAAGMALLTIGCMVMNAALTLNSKLVIALALVMIGLGMGFTATTTLVLAQNSAPPERLGAWTSTIQFLRNIGAAVGVNLLATLQQHIQSGNTYQTCFALLGGSMLVGVIFCFLIPNYYQKT
ncbi:MFS transporter [Dickeya undicola]|uniref:MFS transporter n=1 Tax=Dickeya undicola TaxID=1577887 RepID=A0A3N0FS88_9GAMM|nr:MFS transporter [Dickeya undicola]RNM02957.1 MFS transporter [Dickeya undicola]